MIKYFVLALFIQALIPALTLVLMLVTRIRAVKAGKVPARYFKSFQALDGPAPRELVIIECHYSNLFEVPILFIITGVLFITLNQVDKISLVLAWFFVLSRLIHTYIHLGRNKIVPRLTIFGIGCVALMMMWFYLIGKIFL